MNVLHAAKKFCSITDLLDQRCWRQDVTLKQLLEAPVLLMQQCLNSRDEGEVL